MFKLVQRTAGTFATVSEAIVELVTPQTFRKNLTTTGFQKAISRPRPPSPEMTFSNTFGNFVS